MAAPTSIQVTVDREEYSKHERDRDTVTVTISVTGVNLAGEQITVELRKARFARDIVVATKTITLPQNVDHAVSTTFYLPEIVNSKQVSIVRRGNYFIYAESVTDDTVNDESDDFRFSIITVDRLKADYLHGTDQFASDQFGVVKQPEIITGVTIDFVSKGHPLAASELSYNFVVNNPPRVTTTNTEPFTLVDGTTLILQINGVTTATATFNTADFGDISNATAAEIAAVITADIDGVEASVNAGAVDIEGDFTTFSIFVDPSGTATSALGLTNQSDVADVVRSLSWCDGPLAILESGKSKYVLSRGGFSGDDADYIKVNVSSLAALPFQSRAEQILIEKKPLDEDRMRQIVDQAISWVEDVVLGVYIEPTRITTEADPTAVSFAAGTDIPTLTGVDYDEIVNAVMYKAPSAGHWINWRCPYYPLIEFEELYGKVSNTRIVDIVLEWVEVHEPSGWVELVPFNQEVAFNFIGLVWIESIRGPVPLPNFWNFTALVGFRKTPQVIVELIAKKAAMDILTIAGQAFRAGFASQSVSRDGVSESVSYTSSATFGVYSASIEDYRKWIDANLIKLKGAFRGPNLLIV